MKLILRSLAAACALTAASAGPTLAAGEAIAIPRQTWSFAGFAGNFDGAQLQRGYQVYREVCATCHGLKRIAFRNLVQSGGPEFPEERMKQYAATFKVKDGPDDQGKMFERSAKLADRIPSPYTNEQEARSIHNGAYPPDLSLITLARNTHHSAPWYLHVGLMAKDVVSGFSEGGADYVYSVLVGYKDEAPAYTKDAKGHLKPVAEGTRFDKATMVRCASVTPGEGGKADTCNPLQDGMNYNKYFPGHQIAMVNPFAGGDGFVKYTVGADNKPTAPETVDQYARDVTAFLMWAADPSLEQRKRIGWQVMLYLLVTAVLLYIAKKRIWSDAH